MTTTVSSSAEASRRPHQHHPPSTTYTSSPSHGVASSITRSQSTRSSSRVPTTPTVALPTRTASTRYRNRDYEPSNAVHPSSASQQHRSPSRDRDRDRLPSDIAATHAASHRRNLSRSNSSGNQASAMPLASSRHSEMPPAGMIASPQPAVKPSVAANDTTTSKPAPRSRTTIPTQSGKWILGKTIGAGSMGKVKLARREDGLEQVACKIIPRGSTEDGHQHRADKERADQSKEIRTAREAAIVTLLSHPYICGLRDVVRTNYHWYMLFEYVNGGQMLDYIISHGKLKEKQARKFSRQIASALDYCHRNSIVHRDLKIENILISKTGDIKIIDFGLSNLFTCRSHLKTYCGSLYFAAPELLQARPYTGPEVDVWSFGIVLYVLVCGKVPFDDQSMPALHAKIKKGIVDYPSWLSNECKHLLSRMLVTDPKQRAAMAEVMAHPWMMKGYAAAPENYLPAREPLSLPLEDDVINAMTGFNFGSSDSIKSQLVKVVESEDYVKAVRLWKQEKDHMSPSRDSEKRRPFGLDIFQRRASIASRDTLSNPSLETLQMGSDPLNAFHPLISVYYLVKEKQERDRAEKARQASTGATATTSSATRPTDREPMPEIKAPQEAHTNTSTYEMPGERATGGRSRPRARTHGEDDIPESVKNAQQQQQQQQSSLPMPKSPPIPTIGVLPDPLPRKESTAAGLLRRFSTRRRKDPERHEKDRSHPPVVQIHGMPEAQPTTLRKSFSIRRTRRDRDDQPPSRPRSGSTHSPSRELLSPPTLGGAASGSQKRLGRSTSVNSADLRRRGGSKSRADQTLPTSGSDHSTIHEKPADVAPLRSETVRAAKSLGHARRESIQARRQTRKGGDARDTTSQEPYVTETSGQSGERLDDVDLSKPVFLKGLFSVSTTSTKTVLEIRKDIRGVLRHLRVEFTEIKGGFTCKYAPGADTAGGNQSSPAPTPAYNRRRFSFAGRRAAEREDAREDRVPPTPRTPARANLTAERSDSDMSEVDASQDYATGSAVRRVPGETSTHVQNDVGGNTLLEFEIFIVKVPVLSLHGIQFKRITGNTWQYKNMAERILKELRL